MLRQLLAEATPGTLKAGACVVTSGDIAVACVRQGARLTCQRVECATLIAGRQRACASLLAAAVNNLPALLDAAEALVELHKFFDFEEPLQPKTAMTFDDPSQVNAAMAKAHAAIAALRDPPARRALAALNGDRP
jgi:hypothetical protein